MRSLRNFLVALALIILAAYLYTSEARYSWSTTYADDRYGFSIHYPVRTPGYFGAPEYKVEVSTSTRKWTRATGTIASLVSSDGLLLHISPKSDKHNHVWVDADVFLGSSEEYVYAQKNESGMEFTKAEIVIGADGSHSAVLEWTTTDGARIKEYFIRKNGHTYIIGASAGADGRFADETKLVLESFNVYDPAKTIGGRFPDWQP
jgi:hypothetical protein